MHGMCLSMDISIMWCQLKGLFRLFFRGITSETPIFSNLYNALSNIMNLIHALDNLLYISLENEEKQFVC